MGYYNISSIVPTNPQTPLQLDGGFWMLDTTPEVFDNIFIPVLRNISYSFQVGVRYRTAQQEPNIYDWWKAAYPAAQLAPVDSQLGSRLLDEDALSLPLPILANALQTAYPNLVLLGNLVIGPGVWNAQPAGGLGSMTGAWRKAIVHLGTSKPHHPNPLSFIAPN